MAKELKPTLNRMVAGVESMLGDENYFGLLYTAAKKEFSAENVQFLRAVRIINPAWGPAAFPSSLFPAGVDTQAERIEWIYSRFISDDAPVDREAGTSMVNLPFDIMNALKQQYLSDAPNNRSRFIFDEAYREILALVTSDTYRRLRMVLSDDVVNSMETFDEVTQPSDSLVRVWVDRQDRGRR